MDYGLPSSLLKIQKYHNATANFRRRFPSLAKEDCTAKDEDIGNDLSLMRHKQRQRRQFSHRKLMVLALAALMDAHALPDHKRVSTEKMRSFYTCKYPL